MTYRLTDSGPALELGPASARSSIRYCWAAGEGYSYPGDVVHLIEGLNPRHYCGGKIIEICRHSKLYHILHLEVLSSQDNYVRWIFTSVLVVKYKLLKGFA